MRHLVLSISRFQLSDNLERLRIALPVSGQRKYSVQLRRKRSGFLIGAPGLARFGTGKIVFRV